jgi:hypothetical protein
LNVHHLLVLHHLFRLHFFLPHVQDDRNKKNVLCAPHALVLLNLSEQDGRDVKPPHELGVLDEKIPHVQDDQVFPNSDVQDERLFQDVQILMNPNELDAQYENCLVLSCA